MSVGNQGRAASGSTGRGAVGRGGRAARLKARQQAKLDTRSAAPPYITRRIKPLEVLDEEGLTLVENNADTLLEEIGIDFRDDPEALQVLKAAGAEVRDERVRFPRGLCRAIIQASAPKEFVQHARNPERNVRIGGPHTVFAPGYGTPFVHDLEAGRRYATLADFHNFVKLSYLSPYMHHSGGTVCEPVDVPVNKRHLDMVYAHMRYSDKAFMGSVTHPQRAEDTVAMAKILFGEDFVRSHTVISSLINANSPMTFDATMLGAAKVYARNNQACIVSPFILSGAMSPVTAAGTLAQILAEVLAGVCLLQLIAPGAPCVFGTFSSSVSMQSGAPTFGSPEAALVLYGAAQLARRLGLPFRSGGTLSAAKTADAQAAFESANTLQPTILAGVNFVLHAAGWLEGGLMMSYEKFVMDLDQLGMMQTFCNGIDLSANGQALDALREVGPGSHFLGCAHTRANFATAFYSSSVSDHNTFEQWQEDGSLSTKDRAAKVWRRMLKEYEAPTLDAAVDEALRDYIARRKATLPDSDF